jgi:hypothetical protein
MLTDISSITAIFFQIHVKENLSLLIFYNNWALEVTLQSFTADAWVQSQAIACGLCGEKTGFETDFHSSTSGFRISTFSLIFHTHLHLNTALSRRTSGQILGTFKQSKCSSGYQGALDRKMLLCCQSL